ncbi:MAG: YbaB/EbfC family nucleoid-associated protein [Patescibacteria group bacterium]|jgi:DNA-binding protein YbaB
MFDKAKMLAQAMKLKKAVEAETVEVEEGGIKVIASGDQKIKFLSINGVENKLLVDTVNKALKKSQEAAAKRMKDMGGLEGLF